MEEIIHVHIGQGGIQIANACWDLYCLEHGINIDGSLCEHPWDGTFQNFFSFLDSNKVTPRAILVDSEPTVLDQIRTGPYGRLFKPNSLINGKEDSGSNFARGYFTMGAELIDVTMEAIRAEAENCSNLKGFLLFRAIGGGTGAGLGNLIAEKLSEEYDKVVKLEFAIFPSPSISPLIVEPYNALLATHMGMDFSDCSCILDNEALFQICASKLNTIAPKYKNLNRIIGQTVSTFTTSQRFAGSSNVSFSEFQTNLVPYPRIHFPIVSYAPFIPETGYSSFTTEQITTACFDPSNQLVRVDPAQGNYMASVLLYRGKTSSYEINECLSELRRSKAVRFVDWSPTGFKVGVHSVPPYSYSNGGLGCSNRVVVAFSNNTVIKKVWCQLMDKCNRLHSRRAFIHHYVMEGLEEAAIEEALEDICVLISDYAEVDEAGVKNVTTNEDKLAMKSEPQGSSEVLQTTKYHKSMDDETEDRIAIDDLSLPKLPGVLSSPRIFESDTPSEINISPQMISNSKATTNHRISRESKQPKSGTRQTPEDRTDSPFEESPVPKSISFEKSVKGQPGPKSTYRRSKSHEPYLTKTPSFIQGFDSEAVRAKDRFCSSQNQLQGFNGKFRPVSQDICTNQLPSTSCTKHHSQHDNYKRKSDSRHGACFCCQEDDDLRFANSDENVLPICCLRSRHTSLQRSPYCDSDKDNSNNFHGPVSEHYLLDECHRDMKTICNHCEAIAKRCDTIKQVTFKQSESDSEHSHTSKPVKQSEAEAEISPTTKHHKSEVLIIPRKYPTALRSKDSQRESVTRPSGMENSKDESRNNEPR